MATAAVASCRSGQSKREPFAGAADVLVAAQGWEVSSADRAGVPGWERDLEVCTFS